MCGIAGIWGQTEQTSVEWMMKSIFHRGPDAKGIFKVPDGSGILGHQRFSIMDVDGGDQPIYSKGNSQAIIGNGEIYNYPKLKPELAKKYQFSPKSDTEAVLHLYEEKYSTAVSELVGMFAFAIIDDNSAIR